MFGGDKLPDLARGVGKGLRDFKEATESVKNEINSQINIHQIEEDRRIARNIIAQQSAAANHPQTSNRLIENNKPVENLSESGNIPNRNS